MTKEERVQKYINQGIFSTAEIAKQSGIPYRSVTRAKMNLRASGIDIPTGIMPPPKDPVDPIDAMRDRMERMETSRAIRKKTFYEIVGADIISAINALPAPAPPTVKPLNLKAQHDPEEMVLLWSDSQIGQFVDARESGGLGSYSVDIFLERLEFLKSSLHKIIEIHVANTHCPTFNIFFLGDIIEGSTIFPGQERQTDLHAVKQVIFAVDKIAEFVAWAARLFPWAVRCYCVVGNHGRIGLKGEQSPMNNLDFLVYHYAAEKLKNYANVEFNISESWYMLVEKQGWKFLLIHGDDVKSWNSIPFYGMERSESRYQRMVADAGSGFNYFCCGHHHQEAKLKGRMFLNGNWVGGSELSMKQMQIANTPTQTLFAVHNMYGVTWERVITLRDPANPKQLAVYK